MTKNIREEWTEAIRQEIWHWIQDNPTPIITIAQQMKIDRGTLTRFIYGESNPDMKTVMRIKQFLKEKYEERDANISQSR